MDEGYIAALALLAALLGAPLFAIFAGSAMALFAQVPGSSSSWPAGEVFTERFSDNNLMVTIPLFVFAGYVMAESGTPRRLVALSRAWLGWMPGGLALVCICASAFFTTFTGGSGITIVAVGGLLLPALLADKYSERFSLGLVTTGGSLGLLFPPSLPLILYAIVAEIVIEKLFLAGILPGLLTLVLLAGYAVFQGARDRESRTSFEWAGALRSTWDAKWEVLLPLVIVGGLLSGTLRIHEAAAFAAAYALCIEVFVYRDVSLREDLPRILQRSTTMLGAILVILAAAIGLTGYLIQAQVPTVILETMLAHVSGPFVFLLSMNLFLLLVGMLMDVFSAIVVVAPLLIPVATDPRIGIDPYHLGIIFLLNLEIGYLTPPVGLNLFMSSFRFKRPIGMIYRAVIPFVGLLAIALAITTYVQALSTWLPNLLAADTAEIGRDSIDPVPGEDDWEDDETLDLDDLDDL